jgi:hypothetical protein
VRAGIRFSLSDLIAQNRFVNLRNLGGTLHTVNVAKKKIPDAVSEYMAQIGRKGGKVGGKKGLAALTDKERERIRAKALATRRAKKKSAK